ncbi:MAG: ABC transporter ATP-binding protein [Bacteroidales bacterium]|nr:ABC transporter ATP-binding protein [Bacteroidales bacterium]
MIELNNITKVYRKGTEEFIALLDVSIKIEKGEFIAVSGASGAGKSTLLNIIGGLILPDSGSVLFNGHNIYSQSAGATDAYRKKNVGFMFQQFHLMPYLTVLENIKLACFEKDQLHNIESFLEKCSLSTLKNKYPDELSVGEKQRTAFVRAIITNPEILLADEPTGNLDPENSRILMSLVEDHHRGGGTVILVSHDPLTAQYANRSIVLNKGKLKQ